MKTDLVVAGYITHNNKVLLIHHKKLLLWLPVGGHIEKDETPDTALLREIKEETNLEVEILTNNPLPKEGNTKEVLATPIHVNTHSVGDHDHCCFFYVCKAKNPQELKINPELLGAEWFSKEDLNQENISKDVKNQAVRALEISMNFS